MVQHGHILEEEPGVSDVGMCVRGGEELRIHCVFFLGNWTDLPWTDLGRVFLQGRPRAQVDHFRQDEPTGLWRKMLSSKLIWESEFKGVLQDREINVINQLYSIVLGGRKKRCLVVHLVEGTCSWVSLLSAGRAEHPQHRTSAIKSGWKLWGRSGEGRGHDFSVCWLSLI